MRIFSMKEGEAEEPEGWSLGWWMTGGATEPAGRDPFLLFFETISLECWKEVPEHGAGKTVFRKSRAFGRVNVVLLVVPVNIFLMKINDLFLTRCAFRFSNSKKFCGGAIL